MNSIAPELQVASWLNTARPLSLEQLRGKVVVIYAFQMLCPGCVAHGIPQAKAIRAAFDQQDVAVLGLHSVFEHHEVMNRAALEAFVHEYRIDFPVAIDQPSAHGPIPLTMDEYQLRGTPTLLVIDRQGRLRLHHFGRADDIKVGALIGQLVAESTAQQVQCDDTACSIR
ncbi:MULTISPECIES: redoxin domain-containing protein [unclassified Duganella]|uniref:redoxin domain-containing protein n=1 Tax=unclassified Duganella TaxID=2636909 RepID=UPI0008888823|nr:MULTISPECIES: redoxin domain-containing protein [unclassified Duganella]SDG45014.1 Peroxiredoxin [Duganella sp. OV458]SDJ58871.1 Peroxiredoxin [Duganella sp. OV510]